MLNAQSQSRTFVVGFLALMLLGLLVVAPARAGIDTHVFDTEADRERYGKFIDELRCPKCKNQNLSGSNAPIAQDLRRELHRLIEEGESDQGIVDFMVARYGDFVLYRPPVQKNTYALWYGTAGMLLLGFVILIVVIAQRSRTQARQDGLTDGEQVKLETFLADVQAKQQSSGGQKVDSSSQYKQKK